jgi:hypothetical protein
MVSGFSTSPYDQLWIVSGEAKLTRSDRNPFASIQAPPEHLKMISAGIPFSWIYCECNNGVYPHQGSIRKLSNPAACLSNKRAINSTNENKRIRTIVLKRSLFVAASFVCFQKTNYTKIDPQSQGPLNEEKPPEKQFQLLEVSFFCVMTFY